MDSFRVLDPKSPTDREEWIAIWERSPTRLPYAHPGYGALVADDSGRLVAAVRDTPGSTVLYPFILRKIGDGAQHDITSPYGYGGPMHWGEHEADQAARPFWQAFEAWAEAQGVVSEFVRLALFEELLPYPGVTRARNLNFATTLPDTAEELWTGLHKKVRQGVRRALRMGLTTQIDTEGALLDEFVRVYTDTMERRGSDEWYRFDRAFFTRLQEEMGQRTVIVVVRHEGQVVSSNLLLAGRDSVYAFLGGTHEEAFPLNPVELAEYRSLEWALQHGFRHYVLGGGLRPGDGLERYKRRFASDGGLVFQTGERILDPVAFDGLVEERRRDFDREAVEWDERSDFFPAYRQPLPVAQLVDSGR